MVNCVGSIANPVTSSLIVGCGYIGSALSRLLVDNDQDVYGVSRSGVDLDGVTSLERDVTDPPFDLPDVDHVYYLVSASSRDSAGYRAAYVDGLINTIDAIGDATLVYASSTGVYEVEDGSWVDERTDLDPMSDRSRILLEAEDIARDAAGTVVRFAGLYGPGRTGEDRYLDDARVPAGFLNLLHRDDAASALLAARDGPDDTYLAVDDEPVHRHELARWLADYTGRPAGTLVDAIERSNKRCSNARLRSTGWSPDYPTYREGYAHALSDG